MGSRDERRSRGIPQDLAAADRAFLERAIAAVAATDDAVALFLGGSHAQGTADRWSDLDLYLITSDEGFDRFRKTRRAFMHSLGDAVFLEEHELFGFLMLLYMYADGVHGEMALAPTSEMADVHAGPYRILLDKHRVLEGREFPRWRIDADTRRKLTRRLLVWFFYDRRLLDVALARGRPWTAHHYLERCRQACLDLARLHASPDVFPGGYEKAEDGVDPAHLELFAETVVPLDLDAMAVSAEALTEMLLDLGRQVAKLQDVDFPERLAQSVGRSLGRSIPGP